MPEIRTDDQPAVRAKHALHQLAKMAMILSHQLDRRPQDASASSIYGTDIIGDAADAIVGVSGWLVDLQGQPYEKDALQALLGVYDDVLDVGLIRGTWKTRLWKLWAVKAVLGEIKPAEVLYATRPYDDALPEITRSELIIKLAAAKARLENLVAAPYEQGTATEEQLRVLSFASPDGGPGEAADPLDGGEF